jgi:hypothetical protein
MKNVVLLPCMTNLPYNTAYPKFTKSFNENDRTNVPQGIVTWFLGKKIEKLELQNVWRGVGFPIA